MTEKKAFNEHENQTEESHKLEVVICEIKTDRSNLEKSFVIPGKLHVEKKKKNTVIWEAINTSAVFFFPREELFGGKEFRIKEGDSLELKVSENADSGRYPYTVFTDNNDFAEGGSYPTVIVE